MENKYLKQRVIGIHFFILSVLLIGNSSQLLAINIGSDNFRQNPFDTVEEMTNQLLIIIDFHRSNYPENEEDYFLSLNNLLGDFVEFNFVAKRVMGSSYGKVDPDIEKKGTFASPAMALAKRVFPVPGGPTIRTPFGIRPPSR